MFSLWSANLSWEYPAVFLLAALGGVFVFWFIQRAVNVPAPKEQWRCKPCGARFSGKVENGYRYCPFCGTPRGERYRHTPDYDDDALDLNEADRFD